MSQETPISIGDVARVKKALQPQGAATWNRILKLLDLPLEMREPPTEVGAGEHETEQPPKEVPGVQELSDVDKEDLGATPPARAPLPIFAPGAELDVEVASALTSAPKWSDARNVFSDSNEDASVALDPPPSLFARDQSRALLTAAAIALAETGELDEDRAIGQIARGEPLLKIPFRLRSTSRFGVQLLLDRGPRMQSFLEDQQRLLADLLNTVGAHRVDVLRFAGFPDFAGPGTRRTWRPYAPPAAGTVVLVVTDLSLGWMGTMERTHDLRDWIAWAETVRCAGARPVAFVLHGPRHWPEALKQRMTLVHWDRSTTVGAIRRAGALSSTRRA